MTQLSLTGWRSAFSVSVHTPVERPHTDQNHSGHPWKGPLQEPASEEECFVLNKEVSLKPSFPFMILSQCRYNSLFLLGSSHVNLVSSRFLTVAQGIGIF